MQKCQTVDLVLMKVSNWTMGLCGRGGATKVQTRMATLTQINKNKSRTAPEIKKARKKTQNVNG